MRSEFHQIAWDSSLQDDLQELLILALREDLGALGDCTTAALVPETAIGQAAVVARQAGVVAGLPAAEMVCKQIDARLQWTPHVEDGAAVQPGDRVAIVAGPARGILRAERLLLNLLGRLSGIASLTRNYVDAVAGAKARIFDTRKTTPGWRRLEKYAVRAGGGWNHRTGLFDAILIKDNHLALWGEEEKGRRGEEETVRSHGPLFPFSSSPLLPHPPATRHRGEGLAEAVRQAREWIRKHMPEPDRAEMIVEIEVDTLEQLEEVLPAGPDIVLLDNMTPGELRTAVSRRDAVNPEVELEASGGVTLETVRAIAESGVDRISVGALTHSAGSLDIGLDWIASGP
jgi:nicotinate-nucleotide pyrophosphorylase (carboxylating)